MGVLTDSIYPQKEGVTLLDRELWICDTLFM